MNLGGWMVTITSLILFLTIMGIPTSMTSTFSFFGLSTDSDTGVIIPSDIKETSFWDELFGTTGILVALAGGGLVAIGLFARGYDPSLIYAPFLIVVAQQLGGTFYFIMQYVSNLGHTWLGVIVSFIFIPLNVAFIVSIFNYFGGRQ